MRHLVVDVGRRRDAASGEAIDTQRFFREDDVSELAPARCSIEPANSEQRALMLMLLVVRRASAARHQCAAARVEAETESWHVIGPHWQLTAPRCD